MKVNSESIDFLFKKPVSWLSANEQDPHIALSSRIRIARNIANLKFPITSNDVEREHILEMVMSGVQKSNIFRDGLIFNMFDVSALDRKFLLERHLVSREFCAGNKGSSLFVDADEDFAVMVNEEDHIRLQAFAPGVCLTNLWEKISERELLLNKELPFAFDEKLGYLTSCPTNIGTGIRASIMLSLPGLTVSNQMNQIIYASAKLGMAVRGLYGEGSEAVGYVYQLSNQSTLGESEEEIIARLENTIVQMIDHEKNARTVLAQNRREFFSDFIGRSYAILRHAYIISEKEALNALSVVRMGIDLKMFDSLSIEKLNTLFVMVQDAHLQKCLKKEFKVPELDSKRAELIRKFLIS